jgi:hypothetical protein
MNLLLALLIFTPAHADTIGNLSVNDAGTEARLDLTETGVNGPLAFLFDRLGGSQIGRGDLRHKDFSLSNEAFSFTCHQNFVIGTNCTFFVRSVSDGRANVRIENVSGRRYAEIRVSDSLARELAGVLPVDEFGLITVTVPGNNGTAFSATGRTGAQVILGLTAK